MEQNKALSTVEQNALQVSYEICGTSVQLDIDFVKKYLVRGRSELVTDQELVMFINTCKMQKLNPLANGEVYLIKYSKDEPAQMVVGKDSYNKRALSFAGIRWFRRKDAACILRKNLSADGAAFSTSRKTSSWKRSERFRFLNTTRVWRTGRVSRRR